MFQKRNWLRLLISYQLAIPTKIQFPGSAFLWVSACCFLNFPDVLIHRNPLDFKHLIIFFANIEAPFTGARSKLNICVIRTRTGPPPTNDKMIVNSSEKSFELSDLIKILQHFNLWMIEFHDRLNLWCGAFYDNETEAKPFNSSLCSRGAGEREILNDLFTSLRKKTRVIWIVHKHVIVEFSLSCAFLLFLLSVVSLFLGFSWVSGGYSKASDVRSFCSADIFWPFSSK